MGQRVKGIVVNRREADSELNGSEKTLRELKAIEGTAQVLPVAERAERVKEYRESRKEKIRSNEPAEHLAEEPTGSVIHKPYVVGIDGLKEANGNLYGTVKAAVGKEGSAASGLGENGGLKEFLGEGKKEETKEIAFFSEPKRVKKKTQRSIFIFQSAVCAAVCLIMLISKFTVPQLYENLHIYLTRLFGC